MMKLQRVKKGIPKLNLIPILDSVFIFIFFLLMSTQFVQTHEIGTEAPSVRSTDVPHKKDPLNLTANIYKNKIILTTGLNDKVIKTLTKGTEGYNKELFANTLLEIKKNNKLESSIVFKPKKNVKYSDIVLLMDLSREHKGSNTKLFSEVAFAPAR